MYTPFVIQKLCTRWWFRNKTKACECLRSI